MDFQEELNILKKRCQQYGEKLATEEATKNTLVMPFIKLLGYDVFNPTEVIPEYSAPIGDYKDARVDYALMRDDEPLIIIECKAFGTLLDEGKCNQLRLYFHGTTAKVAILTDGNRYLFFSDLDEDNIMDSKPYMEFVISNPDTALIPEIKKLSRDIFNVDEAMNAAVILKYTREFKRIISEQLKQPDEEFVRFFLHQCYDGKITSAVKDRFTPILKEALALFIRDKINERFQSAIDNNSASPDISSTETVSSTTAIVLNESPHAVVNDNGIITTNDEIGAYYMVKTILKGVIDIEKVIIRDYKSFCNICYTTPRQVIMRCYFNDVANMQIAFMKLDSESNKKEFASIAIECIDDILEHAERIKEIAKFFVYNANALASSTEE